MKRSLLLSALLLLLLPLVGGNPSGALAEAGPAAMGPWPVFRQNNQHTGQAPAKGPATPETKWVFLTGGAILSSPTVGLDGTLYVGSNDLNVYAITSTGSLKWQYKADGPVVSSPAIGPDGTVYVGSSDKGLHAIDPNSGARKWRLATKDVVVSSPVVGADGTIYIGSGDGNLYAAKPDGGLKWCFPGPDPTKIGQQDSCNNWGIQAKVESSPAIGPDGNLYFGRDDGNLYVVDPNGNLVWKYSTAGKAIRSSIAVGPDGSAYFGAKNGFFLVLKRAGSQTTCTDASCLQWWYAVPDGKEIFSSPALGPDGTVYVGADTGVMYALTATPSKVANVKWTFQTGGRIGSSPTITPDGLIIFGSADTYVYAVNAADGKLKWKWKTGDSIQNSSPSVDSTGTVYIGSSDRVLYAIANGPLPRKAARLPIIPKS